MEGIQQSGQPIWNYDPENQAESEAETQAETKYYQALNMALQCLSKAVQVSVAMNDHNAMISLQKACGVIFRNGEDELNRQGKA